MQLLEDKLPFDYEILERHLVLQADNPDVVCNVYGVTKLQDRICLVMTLLSRPHTLAAKLQQMPGGVRSHHALDVCCLKSNGSKLPPVRKPWSFEM